MDLQAFREETRDWLESNCPQSMRIGAVHFELPTSSIKPMRL